MRLMRIRSATLPVMTVLTVIAVAAGFQLGETAVSQIDPLYYQGAAPAPRDVAGDPRPPGSPAFAQAAGFSGEPQAGPGADCDDCPASLVENTRGSIPDQPLYAYSDPTIAPRWKDGEADAAEDEVRPARSADMERVGRYTDYPVTADQAARLSTRPATGPAARPAGRDVAPPSDKVLEPDGL